MRRRQPSSTQQEPQHEFLCTVDTYNALKDYRRGGQCVRLIGVASGDADRLNSDEGVKTFTLDIDYWEFCLQEFNASAWWQIRPEQYAELRARDDSQEGVGTWYRIEIEKVVSSAGNYFYRTFGDEPPQFFHLRSATKVDGVALTGAPSLLGGQVFPSAHRLIHPPPRGSDFIFDSFHVGQGMCSLVHNGDYGVLLDVGAGRPVTRKRYLAGALRNDLRKIVSKLRGVDLVLSHPDGDHWRMLNWDQGLTSQIGNIFVPKGARSIVFKDPAVKSKVQEADDFVIPLNSRSKLEIFRSRPLKPDSNGECLVAVFVRGGQRVLALGDYVYERLLLDHKPALVNLHNARYDGVVVPHHGDRASANQVVAPTRGAKAFFSAGTHKKYGHPTPQAIDAHRMRRFAVIQRRTEANIRRVNLI